MARRMRTALLAVFLCAGCSVAQPSAPSPTAAAADCPVTEPVSPETIPPDASRPIAAGYQGPPGGLKLSMYGNDALWVTIPPDGETKGVPEADGISDKFGTVRLTEGTLTAEGRRLDGPAPPPTFSIPDGYGTTGFQSFAVTFPTEGCWEITQRLAGKELRFVVKVRR